MKNGTENKKVVFDIILTNMHDIHNLQLDVNYKCRSRNCTDT